ncbi:unnamed protein product [Pedinophyceae sp. YPF-701]|nr:unnamed protein product [Pedinophyceae sp. YPF-701]
MAAPDAPNFAAAAAQGPGGAKKEEKPIKEVQIEGLALLKIIKHCSSSVPASVTGQLLGLDVGQTLEITDCFPFPGTGEDGGAEEEGANYQLEMMRCLREINIDNNTVGWYQSTGEGSFQTVELIRTFVDFQASIKRCICVVYEPQLQELGQLPIRAVKLTDKFLKVFQEGVFTLEKLAETQLSWSEVFQEVPIRIHNSPLAVALMAELEANGSVSQLDENRLQVGVGHFLGRNVAHLGELMDDLLVEQQKTQNYHRLVARQQIHMDTFRQRRRQENLERKARGEEPLPEEDPTAFKPVEQPSQLDNLLITNQLAAYCAQMNSFTSQALSRLQLASRFASEEDGKQ